MSAFLAIDRVRAAIAAIAGRQHGVITTKQLYRCGLSSSGIGGWVKSGRLHRVHRGVYAVGHMPVSREGWWMAAALAMGGGAALGHRSAAVLWGFAPRFAKGWAEGPIDVIVPGAGGRARRRGIRVHRAATLLPNHTTRRRSVPVTTPARTLADLRRAVSGREWQAALREAEYLRLPLEGLFKGDGTRSGEEARLLGICRRHRLPEPEVNVPVGPYTVDFLWRAERLVVEVDTYGTHGGRSMFHADRIRDAWLKRHGHEVLRVTDRWMREAPAQVAATIGSLLARRRARA